MKGIQKIPCVRDIKSIHSIGGGCIPKVQRSSCLELYMLTREKDRLEKENYVLNKRKTSIEKQLDSISGRINALQKEIHKKQEIKTYRSVPTKPLKTMPVNY